MVESIGLNMIPKGIAPMCYTSQYDVGRSIRVNLFSGITPYVLDGTETVTLNVRKPDNTIVTAELTNTSASYVTFETTEQMCAVAGINKCTISVAESGNTIASLNFFMSVQADVLSSGDPSESVIHDLSSQVDALVSQYNFAQIDDSEASASKTWSSEKSYNENYNILPTKTASGAIANFKTDISKPVEFEAEFGADVGGINAISITHCGKNLCPKVNYNTTDFTMDANGVYTQNNPASASWAWAYSRAVAHATLPAGIYTITAFAKVSTDRQNAEMRIFSSDNVELTAVSLQNVNKAHVKVAFNTETTIGVAVKIYGGAFYFQIENGSTSSNHEPYDSVTKTISLGDTFYNGGTLSQDRAGHRTITADGQTTNLPDGEPLVARIGTNNIYANTGDMSVNYKESVDEDISKTLADVQRLPWWSRFQSDFLRIAYSDIGLDKINTAVHWLFAADMGFNVLKGDVEITSDGELIMNHDPGFTFDSNGRIISYNGSNNTPIKEMTYAECRSKFYASMPQRFGGYCPVADVDDFIKICKDKGKICFLTIRTTNTEAVVAKALEKIKFYGMESRTILNATHYSIIDTIRENHDADEIAVNYVAPIGTAISKAQVDECLVWGNAFLTIWSANSTTVIDDSAEAIAYAKQKGVPLLSAVCTDMTFWNYIIERGIIGCQISAALFDAEPKTQGFTVKITSGEVTFGNLYSANRFTGNVELSGTKIYVTNICVNNSFLTDVIDGIQPIKMNLLKPIIRCYDKNGLAVDCVWNSTYNRIGLILNDTNDNTYTVLVTV